MVNLGATSLRHYISGTDGTVPGIGGCPFDMDRLQNDYINGAITPSRIIHFTGDELKTDVKMSLSPLNEYGKEDHEILDVIACSGFYETSTLNFRVPNLHKPGAARASDVWVAIPQNIIVPQLVKKLHQGAIEGIYIASLSFLNAGNEDKPLITQVHDFTSCFIKFVDSLSYGALAVFSFSFVKLKITQYDYKQISEKGANSLGGQYVYEFDYNAALGKKG